MKFKLDENLGPLGQALLQADGHDVMTVLQQGLGGADDTRLFDVCRGEGRILITLDHDFGQTLRFPPEQTQGIVVLELRGRASPTMILGRIAEFLRLLKVRPIDGELWIVEPGRVRIHEKRTSL